MQTIILAKKSVPSIHTDIYFLHLVINLDHFLQREILQIQIWQIWGNFGESKNFMYQFLKMIFDLIGIVTSFFDFWA